MFGTIVVASDGSEGAERAISAAAELAREQHARLVIAHLEELLPAKGGTYPLHPDEPEIRRALARRLGDLSAGGLEARLESRAVALGGPARSIIAIAEEAGADLIVVGTRGQTPVAGLLLGGVTQRLLHLSGVPVLAVPPPAPPR